jgi:hypothetical protein
MPPFLIPILAQYGPLIIKALLPLVLDMLQKMGLFTETEAIAAKFGMSVLHTVNNIKIYSAATDFPEEHGNFTDIQPTVESP